MSIERVRKYFKTLGIEDRIMEFDESSATVKEAAHCLGCDADEIAKSLSFLINDQPILIIVSGNSKIQNQKFKTVFQTKAKMIPYDAVEEKIGHAVGGVCPFAVNKEVSIYLDESLKKHEKVYPACGSSNSAIPLTIAELEQYSHFLKWIDVSERML